MAEHSKWRSFLGGPYIYTSSFLGYFVLHTFKGKQPLDRKEIEGMAHSWIREE